MALRLVRVYWDVFSLIKSLGICIFFALRWVLMKRITCTNCKAHILGDSHFCSVCLAMRPKSIICFENIALIVFFILGGIFITLMGLF